MRQQNENAVSPVVGVMLMLVVVIIIAAVVSGFAWRTRKNDTGRPPAYAGCSYYKQRVLSHKLFQGHCYRSQRTDSNQ